MLDEKDLQAIAAMLAPITARLDKLEAGQAAMKTEMATMKTELQAEIKASEGHMIALTEGHFNKGIGILADGHKLIMEQMAKKEDLEGAQEDIRTELDVLKAIVRQHTREIEKLKKAQ